MEFEIFKGEGCEVAVVEHSKNDHTGKHLITFQLRYWRAILAELNTHRMLSKSTSSSRAIPVSKLLEQVRTNPAGPIHWGQNQPGMQAHHEIGGSHLEAAKAEWLKAANSAADHAELMMNLGCHKQVANRALEPYVYVSTVVTGTEWENFYNLRDHEDAQPEIRDLARTMRLAISKSHPRYVSEHPLFDARGWHLPYVSMEERKNYTVSELLAMSSARCARTSYLNHNKEDPVAEEDIKLYKRLVESEPRHASPTEHQASATRQDHRSNNFLGGWIQHRLMLDHCGSLDSLKEAIDGPSIN